MFYQSASLLDALSDFNVIWKFSGPISSDTIAGLLVGLQCIVGDFPALSLALQIIDHNGKVSTIEIIAGRIPIISNYMQYRGILRNSLLKYFAPTDYYGWWIKDPYNNTYSLYRFQTSDFIQGFISAFTIFDTEFRHYIAGPPFLTETAPNTNKVNVFYNIEGYDISPLVKFKRDPAPVGAFYTNQYQEYNFTGTEPLHPTDEIDSEYPRDFQ